MMKYYLENLWSFLNTDNDSTVYIRHHYISLDMTASIVRLVFDMLHCLLTCLTCWHVWHASLFAPLWTLTNVNIWLLHSLIHTSVIRSGLGILCVPIWIQQLFCFIQKQEMRCEEVEEYGWLFWSGDSSPNQMIWRSMYRNRYCNVVKWHNF